MKVNVVYDYVNFSKNNISKYFKLIMGKYFDKEIFDLFLDIYISTRYYNQYNVREDKLDDKITKALVDVYNNITDKSDVSKFILELFKVMYYLDDVKSSRNISKIIEEIDNVRINKLGISDPKFRENFYNLVIDNNKRKEVYLDSFKCNDFKLNKKKILNSDIYNVKISYLFDMPKLYSKYAIDKVYNSGKVMEKKLFLEYCLVSINILNDIIKGKFYRKYLVEYDSSFVKSNDKCKKLFSCIDNDICRDLVSMKISYDDFISNKDNVYKYMRDGYKFSVIIDKDTVIDENDIKILDVFEYILVKKNILVVKMLNSYDNVILI